MTAPAKQASEEEFRRFISQYPIHNSETEPLPYDLKRGTIKGHTFVVPSEADKPGTVFIDNSTMHDSHIAIALDAGLIDWGSKDWSEAFNNSGYETCVKIATDAVIHERLLVDGFVFSNSPRARKIASLFPDVLVPLCFSHQDRISVHEYICETYKPFMEHSVNFSRYEAFHDAKGLDFTFFDEWWHRYTTRNEIELRPPKEEDMFIDLAIPEYLSHSTLHYYRTAYYLTLSKLCHVPYSPHPFREVLLGSFLAGDFLTEERVISIFKRDVADHINEWHAQEFGDMLAPFNCPLVFSRILTLMKQGCGFVEAVREVRESKRARNFRRWCQMLTAAIKAGPSGARDRQKLFAELDKTCQEWCQDLDEGYRYKTRKLTLGISASMLSMSIGKVKDPILWHKEPNLLFLNDLLRAAKRTKSLEKHNEKLTRQSIAEIEEALRKRSDDSGGSTDRTREA